MLKIFYKIIFILIFNLTTVIPQSFGFGCFGFVGGYAGYSYQKYEPGYLNESIQIFNKAMSDGNSQIIPEFGNSQGYRFGINFFRARFSGFFISLKGYYEVLSEDHKYSYSDLGTNIKSELDLNIKNWSVGFDCGIPVTNFLSWKIVDGSLHFNSARLTHKPDLNDNTRDIKYNNDSPELGYSIGTGFVFSIIENFVSLEGTAGYTVMKINKMTTDEGAVFFLRPDNSRIIENEFIKGGGFNAVVQLNVGFPL